MKSPSSRLDAVKEKLEYLTNCVVEFHKAIIPSNDLTFEYLIASVKYLYVTVPVPIEVLELFIESNVTTVYYWHKNNWTFKFDTERERAIYDKYLGKDNYTIKFIDNKQIALKAYYDSIEDGLLDSISDLQESAGSLFDGSDDDGDFTEYNINRVTERMRMRNITPPVR